MLHSHTDHLVITAPSLETGEAYIREQLGVSLQSGGEHIRMGTHNRLLKLGEQLYLEVIAINPNAPAPNRPRWFELDKPDPAHPVKLATWVVRTRDIHAAAHRSPIHLGSIEPMSRGALDWQITIPDDGSLPLQGIAPTLIQWGTGCPHPADALPDSGCSLISLEGFHSQADRLMQMLESIGYEDHFKVSGLPQTRPPGLIANIRTPLGIRQIGSATP